MMEVAWQIGPFELIITLMISITSTNASFLRYFTPARLQFTLPVAWEVILDDSSRYNMYSDNV